ncbi:hypothetical protein QTA56_10995 [Acinetobacter sp. VNH17]|uniref:Uncharacterized protein n=1 Tax=Acinetobacter thutiue TaxID=2998078 RepID=A0ABT7WPZ7_9GAMM|nr:hypothetical protein [Acinetobacter thutiue]MCY6412647.1 hypothetical protein [Acinetobacter thutiue]MDN0014754.1 hypothetical protein [Acinetobacter thutiue]
MNKYVLACGICLVSTATMAELNVNVTRQENSQVTTAPVIAQEQNTATNVTTAAATDTVQTTTLEQGFSSPVVAEPVIQPASKLETGEENLTKRILGLNYTHDSKPFIAFAEAGIFGFGGGVGFSVNPYIDLTAGFNKGSWKDVEFASFELMDGTKYKMDIDTDVKSFYANIRPFAGKFHVTLGMVNQDNKIKGSLEPNEDNALFGTAEYVFDDATFDANKVGKVYGSLHYEKKTMPYIGIGWSPALTSRFGLTTQIGALYAGKPTIELYPENGNLAVQDKDHTTTLGAALEAEKESFKSNLEWFPVAKLGLWLRF